MRISASTLDEKKNTFTLAEDASIQMSWNAHHLSINRVEGSQMNSPSSYKWSGFCFVAGVAAAPVTGLLSLSVCSLFLTDMSKRRQLGFRVNNLNKLKNDNGIIKEDIEKNIITLIKWLDAPTENTNNFRDLIKRTQYKINSLTSSSASVVAFDALQKLGSDDNRLSADFSAEKEFDANVLRTYIHHEYNHGKGLFNALVTNSIFKETPSFEQCRYSTFQTADVRDDNRTKEEIELNKYSK